MSDLPLGMDIDWAEAGLLLGRPVSIFFFFLEIACFQIVLQNAIALPKQQRLCDYGRCKTDPHVVDVDDAIFWLLDTACLRVFWQSSVASFDGAIRRKFCHFFQHLPLLFYIRKISIVKFVELIFYKYFRKRFASICSGIQVLEYVSFNGGVLRCLICYTNPAPKAWPDSVARSRSYRCRPIGRADGPNSMIPSHFKKSFLSLAKSTRRAVFSFS